MDYFDHEKLDVYRLAVKFVGLADEIIEELPKGRSYLADQLHRAAASVSNNIAEGAGEFAPKEKKRFYRMARRSATECAAVLDVIRHRKLTPTQKLDEGRKMLLRIVSMLTRLVVPPDRARAR